MSSNLLEKIGQMLNEEKWTRATIKSYTINNFKDLNHLIKDSGDDESLQEVLKLCEEHLVHSKNSIIGLYISGILSLSKHIIDDSNLIVLINIFSDNHKWNIVEYLCERILDYGENKVALRMLAECYENEGENDKKIEVWERLIKVDYDETEIIKHLAEKHETEGSKEKAIDYYKKAIHRYANKKQFSAVKELWTKLIDYCPDEIDFFYHLAKKVTKTIGEERACQLLEELYEHYKKRENWNYAIDILKHILVLEPANNEMRSEIIFCFTQKYSYHSQVEEYIKISNLSQKWRNIHEAIADFEKHISFEINNFVFHRSWGIGKITDIKGDNVVIDFIKKKKHPMSLKMAVNALTMLGKEHFWVYKSTKKKEDLRKMIKGDTPWTLKTIIKSFGNSADIKRIKSELVPSILTAGEWTSWSNEARKILKTNTDFGNLPDKADFFVVRDKPITFEEKAYNNFKAEAGFFDKLKTLLDFVDEVSIESDYFPEMFQYFTNYLKSYSSPNEFIICSYLLVDQIVSKFPHLNPGISVKFNDFIKNLSDIPVLFTKIADSDLKKLFLDKVKKYDKNWSTIYLQIFPQYLNRSVIDALIAEDYKDKVTELVKTIYENYKEYRESFIWILKHVEEYAIFEKASPGEEKILVNAIYLLDITYREIVNKRNVSNNKKINKQLNNYLFKDKRLEKFILNADKNIIIRMISLIDDTKGVDPAIKIEIKKKIKDIHPDIKFIGIEEEIDIVSRGLIVTAISLENKKKELKHILEVEIPNNSKEIGAAIALGDLRENAEYKAGKEKQEILNATVGKLKEDIEKCYVFDPSTVNTGKISFGTKAILFNNDAKAKETYTILGPWESSPENNIISYMAPFGSALLNAKVNENLNFTINDRNYNYTVKKITKTELI
ncbi:MAG: transcription elongation factor GreA [Spirochaetaceae bacterium]|nr:transcription elongation factor GreA [Spirochaetaceae bacterium]